MGFADLNQDIYKDLKKKRHGYICPECGNLEHFRAFSRQVELITQNEKTGIIESIELDKSLQGLEREIDEVQCSNCGAIAEECKKGIEIDDNAEVE